MLIAESDLKRADHDATNQWAAKTHSQEAITTPDQYIATLRKEHGICLVQLISQWNGDRVDAPAGAHGRAMTRIGRALAAGAAAATQKICPFFNTR